MNYLPPYFSYKYFFQKLYAPLLICWLAVGVTCEVSLSTMGCNVRFSAKISPINIALYPLYFDVTLTTLLVQAANKRNKKLVFLMQQIYLYFLHLTSPHSQYFLTGCCMFKQDKTHLYSNVKDETIGKKPYQFDILQRLRLIS